MIAMNNEAYADKLKTRRGEIMMTLEHVQKEQRAVDENKDWMDCAASESRRQLLDNLAQWYVNEIRRIDNALIRIAEGKYGFCAACHQPIEARRLATIPEADFCAECQETRDALRAA